MPSDHKERIFALRIISASALSIQDEDAMTYSFNEFSNILSLQPKKNDIGIYLLTGNLAQGATMLKYPNPFSYREKALKYFGNISLDSSIHETSFIKREIQIYTSLDSSDKQTMVDLAKRGLVLANKYNYTRHQKFFKDIITK